MNHYAFSRTTGAQNKISNKPEYHADVLPRILGNQSYSQVLQKSEIQDTVQRVYIGDQDNPDLGKLKESRKEASSSDIVLKGASAVDPARGAEFNTYHHIIPMNLLTSYWNKLISFQQQGRLRAMMGSVIDNANVNMRNAGAGSALKSVPAGGVVSGVNTFNTLRANVDFIGRANTDREPGVDRGEEAAQAMEDIASFYQWLPGNLVLGPATVLRPYDGNDKFDCEAAYAREVCNGDVIDYYQLYYNMKKFNALAQYDAGLESLIHDDLVFLSNLPVYIPGVGIWVECQEAGKQGKKCINGFPNEAFIKNRPEK